MGLLVNEIIEIYGNNVTSITTLPIKIVNNYCSHINKTTKPFFPNRNSISIKMMTEYIQPSLIQNYGGGSRQPSRKNEDTTDSPNATSSYINQFTETHTDMKIEINRLNSYKHQNWKCNVMDVQKLANVGFYYFGKEDHVRCAFCKVEIGKWEQGDDANSDHQRWSPRCPFLRGYDVGNVPINPNASRVPLKPRSQDTCGRYNIEIRPNSVPEHSEASEGGVNLSALGITPNVGPSYKEYCTEESRLRTFSEWPRSLRQKPEQLAQAGFFYTGKGDQTLCFHCGGGLKDWEEDDEPWEQHARWFSKCTFVLMNKGRDFVQKVCNDNPPMLTPEQALELTENPSASTVVPARSESCSSAASSSKVQEESTVIASPVPQNKEPMDSNNDTARLCKICYTEELGVLFLPCGHIVACVKCAPSLTTCAVCRQPFTATVRAFLS